jgi:hypothetical protein
VGEDAEYVVTVRQLPDAKKLVFKTLQSYSDGRVDRWIELEDPAEDGHGHGDGHPEPHLELKPAAPGAKPGNSVPQAGDGLSPVVDRGPIGVSVVSVDRQPVLVRAGF